MPTFSSRFKFPIWAGTDEFKRDDFNSVHQNIDNIGAMIRNGSGVTPTGISPSISDNIKCFWYNTETKHLWYSNGVEWIQVTVDDLTLGQNKMKTDHRLTRRGAATPQTISGSTLAQGDIWVNNLDQLKVLNVSNNWVPPAKPENMPWGMVARTICTNQGTQNVSTIASPFDVVIGGVALAATFTPVTGRAYKVTAYLSSVFAETPTVTAELRLKVGATTYGRSLTALRPLANSASTMRVEAIVEGLPATSTVFKATLQSTDVSLLSTAATVFDRTYILIEDIGPSLA